MQINFLDQTSDIEYYQLFKENKKDTFNESLMEADKFSSDLNRVLARDFNFSLLGDMIINGYFVIMSIYGWYYWSRKRDEVFINNISILEKKEYIQMVLLALGSIIFIYFVYVQFDKWNSWIAYVDNITTAIFFVAMWLMAKRKIESWIFWIIGDLITVPLYFYKGLTISSLQYLIFTVIAILGYLSWKKILHKTSH